MTSAAGSPGTGRAADPPGGPEQPPATRAVIGTDPSDRDWARTRSSDATAPPPPVTVAAVEAQSSKAASASAHSAAAGVRPVAARRSPLLVQAAASAAVAGGLALAVATGPLPLVASVVVLQVVLVRSVLALLDAPAAGSALVVAGGTGLAADLVVLADDGRIHRLTAVVGLGLVAALLAQLVRRGRSRVTESLADTLLAALAAASAACLVALSALERGQDLLLLALAAAAAALLVGRLADRLLPRPGLAAGSTRGWPGLLLGLLTAVGTALAVTQADRLDLEPPVAVLIALAVAATAVAADLALDLGAAELRAGRRDRRRAAALGPAAALLPYALLGPVVLLAGRLVLG